MLTGKEAYFSLIDIVFDKFIDNDLIKVPLSKHSFGPSNILGVVNGFEYACGKDPIMGTYFIMANPQGEGFLFFYGKYFNEETKKTVLDLRYHETKSFKGIHEIILDLLDFGKYAAIKRNLLAETIPATVSDIDVILAGVHFTSLVKSAFKAKIFGLLAYSLYSKHNRFALPAPKKRYFSSNFGLIAFFSILIGDGAWAYDYHYYDLDERLVMIRFLAHSFEDLIEYGTNIREIYYLVRESEQFRFFFAERYLNGTVGDPGV